MTLSETDKGKHSEDDVDDVNSADKGVFLAEEIAEFMARNNITLPKDALVICFGAGQGVPETAFIEKLGLKAIFVDKNYTREVVEKDQNPSGRIQKLQKGMFEFLSQESDSQLSIVTAIGMEYFLDNENTHALIRALPSHLKKPAFVAIYPFNEPSMESIWRESGFVPVLEDTDDIYRPVLYAYL